MTDLAGKGAEALAKYGAEKIQDAIEHFLAEEEPMTALKAPCQHGRYDEHHDRVEADYRDVPTCPGGSLLPPDSLVIVKEDGEWPAGMRYWWDLFETLLAMQRHEDALAAAQRSNDG